MTNNTIHGIEHKVLLTSDISVPLKSVYQTYISTALYLYAWHKVLATDPRLVCVQTKQPLFSSFIYLLIGYYAFGSSGKAVVDISIVISQIGN